MSAASPPPEPTSRDLAFRLVGTFLRPHWATFAASMLCGIVFAGLSAALAAVLKPAIDDLVVHHKPGALTTIPLLIVALAIARGVALVGQAILVNRVGNAIVGDVQAQLFSRLIRADLARLRTEHTGAYVSSVLYDAGLIRESTTTGVVNFTQNALIVAGTVALMFYYDPWLASAVLLAGPIVGAVMRALFQAHQ